MTRREWLLLSAAQRHAIRGSVLVHEHVLVDFVGASQIRPGRYDPDEAFRAALPKLKEVAGFGCRRMLECTPNFLGRDPQLLARLSDASGVELWTNTGLYAAGNHRFLPSYARSESAAQLARRWVTEARSGVDGIRPRFIKIGVNRGPLHELDRKIVEAAVLTSRETGLTIASHTGDGKAALEQLDIVARHQGDPARFVWVHAQNERDPVIHAQVARAGAWVEFDGINAKSADWHLDCVRQMASIGLLERTLISQDSGWYRVGEPAGGDFRPYTYIYTHFVPQLTPAWATLLLLRNPLQAFGN